jgi:fructose-1,6-bisphosphatase-3
MTEYGTFAECTVNGVTKKGKDYMDYLDDQVRKAYYAPDESEETGHRGDIMWYLWLSGNSPLFGKDQMTTFERCFIADKKTHKEHTMPYYKLIDNKEVCEMILEEFGLNPKTSHILNGHVPVKIKDGESPVRAGGRRIVIDGGISKAYQKTTGIAGYTFIFNSWTMALAEHKPYEPMREDGTQTFYTPKITTVETLPKRMMVRDSDQGRDLEQQVEDLKELVAAYRSGKLKEVF